MKPLNFIGILLLLTFAFTSKGQQLIFQNISNELGLPAQESYNIMQDSRGFIWISTEAGLCKFNGSYSTIFDKKNGLPENSCYVVTEDSYGVIWILTSRNHVMCYEKDRLFKAAFSKHFSQKLNDGLSQGYSLIFKNDSIIINTQSATFITSRNSQEVFPFLPDTNYGYYFTRNQNTFLNVHSEANNQLLKVTAKNAFITFGIRNEETTTKITLDYPSNDQPDWRVLTASNKKHQNFIAAGNYFLKINLDLSYEVVKLPNTILSVYCDEDNGLWVGTSKGGVHYYESSELHSSILNLNGYSVTGICVDDEQGVWCTTLEKGVFYCRNKHVVSYSNFSGLGKPVDFLKYEGGYVFSGSIANELVRFNKNNIEIFHLNFLNEKPISDILFLENGWLISGKNFVVNLNEKFSNPVFVRNEGGYFYAGLGDVVKASDKNIYGIHYGAIYQLIDDECKKIWGPLESGGRCIENIDRGVFLYGCTNGLYKLIILSSADNPSDSENFANSSVKIDDIDGAVTKIFRSASNEVWVTTKESGIYIYQGDSLFNATPVLKLPTERFNDITEDKFGRIWLASNVGLFLISPTSTSQTNGENISSRNVNLYTTLNGLSSNEIYKVACDRDFVYVSTTEGLCRFSLYIELANKSAPTIYLNSLSVNGELFELENNFSFQLEHDRNSLNLNFDALTFKETKTPTLSYILTGRNENSIKEQTLKGSSIVLDNLPPDIYQLTVYAVNNDGTKSEKPVILNFEILEPFWQSVWFIFLGIFSFAIIAYVLVLFFTKRIRKKEEEKTRINKQLAEFQLTALQAQMNPHFIFNAINSIQNYILKSQEQEAYNYLAKFSKLIRMVLNNSEEKSLMLSEELEMVKLYVELEQLRFKKDFEFKLCIDETIDIYSVEVPTMLIQPYIENSIWHGLMNRGEEFKCFLIIDISLENNLLKIVIRDNGIGREQAAQFKKQSVHKPIAMKLTEKRLMMINSMKDYIGAKVEVIDLKDDNGVGCGTQIEIYLPV